MRLPVVAIALVALTACGQDKGPGITGEYFTRFEAMGPSTIALADQEMPAAIQSITPAGEWLVQAQSGAVYLIDPDSRDITRTLSAPPSHFLSSAFLMEQGTQYSEDGVEMRPLAFPEGITVNSVATDPYTDTIVIGGTKAFIEGQSELVGVVFESTDLGATWTQRATALRSAQGTTGGVGIGSAVGWITAQVCPDTGVVDPNIPICNDFTIVGDNVHQGTVYNKPTPFALDADGRIIARGEPEATGPNTPDLVLVDPSEATGAADALDHFHMALLPIGPQLKGIDGSSTMWVEGWSWDGYQIFRSVEPLGASHDQRSEVLGGAGCDDLYKKTRTTGYTGDPMEITVTNSSDETIWVDRLQADTLSFIGVEVRPPLKLEPGESGTLTENDEEWIIAFTPDGRCKGLAIGSKMDGRTLR